MNKILILTSLILSLLSLSFSGFLLYERNIGRGSNIKALNAYTLSKLNKGDFLSVSGYMVKEGAVYVVYETNESAVLSKPHGYAFLTVLHPNENIKEACDGVWVNLSGYAEYSFWGDSVELVHSLSDISNGSSCMVDSNLRIKYLEVLKHKWASQ